jgi:hypothetical protein
MSLSGVASCLFRMLCSASMFETGGVFSSSRGRKFLSVGVDASDLGRVGLRSGDLAVWRSSTSTNLAVRSPLSGDRRSKESLSLLMLGLCRFCIRLFCARITVRSGDVGGGLLV